jgi:hypothetical protein
MPKRTYDVYAVENGNNLEIVVVKENEGVPDYLQESARYLCTMEWAGMWFAGEEACKDQVHQAFTSTYCDYKDDDYQLQWIPGAYYELADRG